MEEMLIGVVDRTIPVFIPDPASTTGAGKAGLVAANMTITMTRYETDNDVVHTDVTSSVNDLSALTDAHNDWGWKEVNSTLSKGQYRLDVADAAFASGAWYVVIEITITSGTAPAVPKAFRLVAVNALDAVRMGLTALPNAAADGVGGLPISDAGGLDLDAKLANTNEVTVARMGALTDWINGGRLDLILDDILLDTGTTLQGELDGIQTDTEDIQTRLPAALVGGRIDATIDATGMETGAVDAILNRDASASTTNSTLGAIINDWENGGRLDLIIDDILADTVVIGATGAGLTSLATAAELAKVPKSDSNVTWNATALASIQTEANDALVANGLDHLIGASVTGTDIADNSIVAYLASKSATADWDSYVNTTDALEANRDNIGTAGAGLTAADDAVITAVATLQTSVDDLPTNAELATSQAAADDATLAAIAALSIPTVAQIWTTALTESYRGTGATGTGAQLLYELLANIVEFAIVSTTKTAKKIDGSTTAKTYTLDSSSSPTSITETT